LSLTLAQVRFYNTATSQLASQAKCSNAFRLLRNYSPLHIIRVLLCVQYL